MQKRHKEDMANGTTMLMEWRDVRWKEWCGVGECEEEWRALASGECAKVV